MTEGGVFDEYEEIVPLGKGHDVWLVLNKSSKKVFVKKCRQDFDLDVYEKISRIQDLHIPRIFQYQKTGEMLYIIEEYISGETLEEKMDQGYIFTRDETVTIMIQLCEGLECLHVRFKPIIHRDIKPSNIMISGDGIVKLIDYNAARCYEEGASQDTRYMGTPGFAAPEQYGFSQSDERSDIYSVGIVMNYMLTGRTIQEETPEGKLGEIVKKCTQMDPGERYDSVYRLKEELQKSKKQLKSRIFSRLYAGSTPQG